MLIQYFVLIYMLPHCLGSSWRIMMIIYTVCWNQYIIHVIPREYLIYLTINYVCCNGTRRIKVNWCISTVCSFPAARGNKDKETLPKMKKGKKIERNQTQKGIHSLLVRYEEKTDQFKSFHCTMWMCYKYSHIV